ncbi:hypothetical protein BH23GEM9_BH23GEM9_15290 [soil metagenome]
MVTRMQAATPHCAPSRDRSGSALLLALLFLLIINVVVLGTIQLAMIEQRLSSSATAALRLRLAAQSAAASGLPRWSTTFDSLLPAGPPLLLSSAVSPDGLDTEAYLEALYGGVFMVRGQARERPPGYGVAAAVMLMTPPALPVDVDPAAAAIVAQALMPDVGRVSATPPAACPGGSAGIALLLTDPAPTGDYTPTVINGAVAAGGPQYNLATWLPRITAAAPDSPDIYITQGDLQLSTVVLGVLLVTGDAHLTAGAQLEGLLVVGGSLTIEAGATLNGAAHAGGTATVRGDAVLDPCAVERVVSFTGLDRIRLLKHRPVIPAF